MKEFYDKLLKDQFAITGVREVEFMAKDEIAIRVTKLAFKSRQFDYIPEAVQKKTIEENMMAVDKDFRGLTPSVVHKWLRAIADHWWSRRQGAEIPDTAKHEVSEETMAEVNRFAKSLLDNGGIRSVPQLSPAELEQIRSEDKKRQEGKRVVPVHTTRAEDPRQEKIRDYVKGMGKWIHELPEKIFEIEGLKVPGDSEEEAQQIFMMALSAQELQQPKPE